MSSVSFTLDQVQVFLCVAEARTFSAAARRLRRAQSAVSYSIKRLEQQLGVELFDRSERVPSLTAAGEALLVDARALAGQAARLGAHADSMAEGTEAQVSLVVDVMLPLDPLIEVLRAFRGEFPLVSLRLHSEALGAVAQLVLDGVCQVGICGPTLGQPALLEAQPLSAVRMVPVAAPLHPLSTRDGRIPASVMREAVQIVLSDRSRITEGLDLGVLSSHTWRVSDLATKRELLLAGFGWGSMPHHLVDQDLKRRRLVQLRPAEWVDSESAVPLFAIHRSASPPGPAARWLLERLRARCGVAEEPRAARRRAR